MQTINAEHYELMRQFHNPNDEKWMVVVLPENRYDDWLRATPDQCEDFLRLYPSNSLKAETASLR